MLRYFFVLLCILSASALNAQTPTPQDCLGAVSVCKNVYIEPTPYRYTGDGNYLNEILRVLPCYVEESQGVWYTFTALSDGYFKFTLSAESPDNEDYDWIFFDLTNANCSDLATDPVPYVLSSNNYGSFTGNQYTGADSDKVEFSPAGNCNGPGETNGPNYNDDIPVTKGNTYVLYVSNWAGSTKGYTIDFSESNAKIFDDESPTLKTVDPIAACTPQNQFDFQMSENVLCNSVNKNSFQLLGPNGEQIPIVDIISSDCTVGAPHSKNFQVVVENALGNGSYLLKMDGGIDDLCRNPSQISEIEFEISIFDVEFEAPDVQCRDKSSFISMKANGGTAPYVYSKDNGNSFFTTSRYDDVQPNTYQLVVQDAVGCEISKEMIIQPGSPVVINEVNIVQPKCFGQLGQVSISVSGGISELKYSLGNNSPKTLEPTITGIEKGSYLITVSDAIDCSDFTEITITEPEELKAIIEFSNLTCFENKTGWITYTVTGGVGEYTAVWLAENSDKMSTLIELDAGKYTLSLNDANLCELSKEITLLQPDNLELTMTLTHLKCFGDETGGFEFVLSGGTPDYSSGLIYDKDTEIDLSQYNSLKAGNYHFAVEDINKCTLRQDFIITSPDEIRVIKHPSNLLCHADSKGKIGLEVFGGTGEFVYSINNGGTFTTNSLFTQLDAAIYDVKLKDQNNCEWSDTLKITEPDALLVDIESTDLHCFEDESGTIIPDFSGGTGILTAEWKLEGSPVLALNSLSAGTYELNLSDENNCDFQSTIVLSQPGLLIATLTTTDPLCFNESKGELVFAVEGGTPSYTSVLTTADHSIIPLSEYEQLKANSYNLVITDINKCVHFEDFIINQPPELVVQSAITDVKCNGGNTGSVIITATGGTPDYLIEWEGGETEFTLSHMSAGEYNAQVYDENDCSKTITATVVEPTQLKLDLDAEQIDCHGDADGSIDVKVEGETKNLTYVWRSLNNSSASDLSKLAPDYYYLEIIDELTKVCAIDSVEITQPEDLIIAHDAPVSVCNNKTEGVIELGVTGGVEPYNYQWSLDGEVVAVNLQNAKGGRYELLITDDNICENSIAFEIKGVTYEPIIEMPNIFTPNNDQRNDRFNFITLKHVDKFKGVIFSRWGRVVYTWHFGEQAWDGLLSSGKKASEGTYYYVITITGGNEKPYQKKGFFLLTRP